MDPGNGGEAAATVGGASASTSDNEHDPLEAYFDADEGGDLPLLVANTEDAAMAAAVTADTDLAPQPDAPAGSPPPGSTYAVESVELPQLDDSDNDDREAGGDKGDDGDQAAAVVARGTSMPTNLSFHVTSGWVRRWCWTCRAAQPINANRVWTFPLACQPSRYRGLSSRSLTAG